MQHILVNNNILYQGPLIRFVIIALVMEEGLRRVWGADTHRKLLKSY